MLHCSCWCQWLVTIWFCYSWISRPQAAKLYFSRCSISLYNLFKHLTQICTDVLFQCLQCHSWHDLKQVIFSQTWLRYVTIRPSLYSVCDVRAPYS